MYRTLSQLRDSINQLIEQQGEDAPVAAFIFTNEDVFTMNEDDEQVTVERGVAANVLCNLESYDYIYEQIFNCIDEELTERGLQPND